MDSFDFRSSWLLLIALMLMVNIIGRSFIWGDW